MITALFNLLAQDPAVAETVREAVEAASSSVEAALDTATPSSDPVDVIQGTADTADVLQEAASSAPDNFAASGIQEGVNQLNANSGDLAPFLFAIAITVGLGFAFYTLFYTLLKNIFRQFKSDLPLVALGTSRLPLTLVIIALGLNTAFGLLPEPLSTGTFLQGVQKVLSALVILSVTYWVTELFRKVVIYALKQYAADSEAAWDDVLVPFIDSAAPIVLYIGGTFLAFQAVGVDLSGIWVALGGLSFVLGFAAQGILSNFFSGLVLLIDTPFRFGDVIMHNDERAIVRKIGLRTTNLYLIDSHCEVFVPNGSMQSSDIVNLSRPTPHYYYTVGLSLPSEVNPQRASKLMQEVVLAHPDTLGDISRKLELTGQYFGFSGLEDGADDKREAGRFRLNQEKYVNEKLIEVEQQTRDLKSKIKHLEEGGLDDDEIESVKYDFLSLCKAIGLSPQKQAGGFRGERLVLDEDADNLSEDTLIHTIRSWYSAWLKDPDLVEEDRELLPQEWEQKIGTLKKKFSRFFAVVLKPDGQETRLDDYIEEIEFWLRDSFKSSRNEWQDPKVWIGEQYMVRFYIDDITLERGQRGLRIQNEVHRALIWHLRQTYLLR